MTVSTFDGIERIITLASGIPLASGVNTTDAESEIYSEWKRWAKLNDNAKFAPAFRTIGGDPLGGGIEVGAYFFLQNQARTSAEGGWIIKPPEQHGSFSIEGNIFGQDAALPVISGTAGSFTTQVAFVVSSLTQQINAEEILSILSQSELSNATFDGTVTVDTVNGVAGTEFPIGNRTNPVNNLADARIIADSLNLRHYTVENGLTVNTDHTDWTMLGSGDIPGITLISGTDLTGTVFENVIVAGNANNNRIHIRQSLIGPLLGMTANVNTCAIQGPITVGPGVTLMGFCISTIAGFDPVQFTVLSSGTEISLRQYSGGFELGGLQSGDSKVSVDLVAGNVILGPTNTEGDITVRGVGTLTNNAQPEVNVISTGLMSTGTTATAVWAESTATTVSGSFGEFVTSKVLTVAKFLGLK